MSGPTTRKELYERIVSTSKDEVVLEEMIRLGFWPAADASTPADPADEIRRIGELERKLQQLAGDAVRLRDPAAVKAELLKRRLAASREKRAATKQRREDARHDRAEAWAQRKRREILYLGDGVSTALGKRDGRVRPGLPELHDAASIARAIGISVGQLRFLTFHRKVSATTHWRRFQVPKKTGGLRLISAPMPRLKSAQRWVLEQVLEKLPVHDAAHGFVAGRSIVTNAAVHVGQEVVVNFDLRDFFPTLTWVRVRGLFASLGYSPEAATILGLLCTEPDVDVCEIDGRRWYVHRGERKLPQGSPCSPAITNAICVRLDQRLSGLARKLGLRYSRYADDLTFSGPASRVKTVLGAVRAIVEAEGFVVHPDKTRVMRSGERQEVTGLVVNRRLGVSRHHVRRWRAALFHARKDGPANATFGRSPDVFASLHGFAAFVAMVEPEKGARMLAEVGAAASAHGWTAPRRTPPRVTPVTPAAPEGEPPPTPDKGRWWQFWKWFS